MADASEDELFGKPASTSLPIVSVAMARRLRKAVDWRTEIDGVLETLGRALSCHRSILFRMRDLPDKGFSQSVEAYWSAPWIPTIQRPPTVIVPSMIRTDKLLEQLAEDVRQGKIFAGNTRDLTGFLRNDFEHQQIKSFLSVAVFAHGQFWGTLAVNDCVTERNWTESEKSVLDMLAM